MEEGPQSSIAAAVVVWVEDKLVHCDTDDLRNVKPNHLDQLVYYHKRHKCNLSPSKQPQLTHVQI